MIYALSLSLIEPKGLSPHTQTLSLISFRTYCIFSLSLSYSSSHIISLIRTVLIAFVRGLVPIGNIMVVVAIVWLVFAILGVQLWKGSFNYCNDETIKYVLLTLSLSFYLISLTLSIHLSLSLHRLSLSLFLRLIALLVPLLRALRFSS